MQLVGEKWLEGMDLYLTMLMIASYKAGASSEHLANISDRRSEVQSVVSAQ